MDNYEQHEKIGAGNSVVYRATRLADGERVALKRYEGWAALPPAKQEAALREEAALKRVDHPHAIKLLDTFSDKGDLCMVLPLVRPGARVFEEAALPLSPAAVARVGAQLASALAYLHGHTPPLLHRDIKPANLLLQAAPGAALPPPGPIAPARASALVARGTLILSDFGSSLELHRTLATGTVSGTPAYKAGEILREDEYAAPADVWAYGATLLQLATGHVVGGTSEARKALMGHGAAQWTLQGALAGAFHEKSSSGAKSAEEEAWGAACAAQRAAWGALGEPLRSLIESCLVVQAEGRASAAALAAHTAFASVRSATAAAPRPPSLARAAASITPVSPAALAIATQGYATLLGCGGAAGAVFGGELHGVPVAVRRCQAPPGVPAEVLHALRARFRAGLPALATLHHPRIVRMLHTCEDPDSATYPLAMVYEQLEGGSLAEWLRGPAGEAPRRGALSPLQRIDAAFGVALGLKYLHGMREEGEEGTSSVHCDVSAANVGFCHSPGGGELYAKVWGSGFAKALQGGDSSAGGGAGGASFTSGVLGTPGFMAPELANGLFSVSSEIYSFGVVLLELLRGQRVAFSTANAAREGAEDEGVGHVAALAEAAWPPPAATALAALVVDCIHARPKRRLQSMEPILARLREVRALLAPPTPLVLCPVCLEEVAEEEGVRCKAASAQQPAQQHFCCRGCLQVHVSASVSVECLARSEGGVPCVAAGCPAPPWTLQDLTPHLHAAAAAAYAAGMRYHAFDLPRMIHERREAQLHIDGEIRRTVDLAERVQRTRMQVVEEDFSLHCPRCQGAFVGFEGPSSSAALSCMISAGPPRREGCGICFCALCLQDCAGDAHAHVREVHAKPALKAEGSPAMYLFTPAEFAAAHRAARLGKLAGRLRGLAGEPRVQEALLGALAGADLEGVGLSVGRFVLLRAWQQFQREQGQQQWLRQQGQGRDARQRAWRQRRRPLLRLGRPLGCAGSAHC